MEIWKDIAGYEGYYQISNLGRVKSLERKVLVRGGGFRTVPEKIRTIQPPNKSRRYLTVVLHKDGVRKTYHLYRLLAETFIPNPDNLPEVTHIDGNYLNDSLDNLKWVTHSYNKIKERDQLV